MAKISKVKDTAKSKKPSVSSKQAPSKKSVPAAKKAAAASSKIKKATDKAAAAQKAAKSAKPAKAVKPVKTVAEKPAVKAVKQPEKKAEQKSVKAPAAKAVAPAPAPVAVAPKKPEKLDFAAGDFVVYPAHGVGQVEGVETTTIAGMEVTLYTICFEKDRMRLKLPVSKVKSSGLRKLSSKDRLKDALGTLQGRSQVRRIMWSRRAQEYEAKINSGDPVSIAEVLRDLRKADETSEQSYSERQIYQAALERLAREVAAIEKIDEKKAAEKLEAVLSNVA